MQKRTTFFSNSKDLLDSSGTFADETESAIAESVPGLVEKDRPWAVTLAVVVGYCLWLLLLGLLPREKQSKKRV